MAVKTFVPQCVKDAKKLSRYINKHDADLNTNLSSPQYADVQALKAACDAVVVAIPIVVETP